MAEGYKILPHTSEVGLWIGAATYKAFYRNAARGLLEIWGLKDTRGSVRSRTNISLRAVTPEELLVDWLNELIYLVHTRRVVPRVIRFDKAGAAVLNAQVAGPRLEDGTVPAAEIKAATYHGLKVSRRGGLFTARVILDV